LRDEAAAATDGKGEGFDNEAEVAVEVAAEDGSGGRERREAGDGAAAVAERLLVYCGEKAGGRVHRNGDGGGCGKDGEAADTGE